MDRMQYLREKNFIIFNDINSKDLGLIITKMPTDTIPIERHKEYSIPGRNGSIYEFENCYDNYTMDIEFIILDVKKLRKIANVFKGVGEVILSSDLTKKYKVVVKNKINIEQVGGIFKSFLLQLDTFPFKYSANDINDNVTLTQGTTIFNKGNYTSEPTITIYGQGNITLKINDKNYELEEVEESIVINSEIMEVYKINGNDFQNQNNKYMSNEYPNFEVGVNTINFIGDVRKIEIEPKWRWL